MENFVLILLYLTIGIAMRKVPKFPADTALVINTFVLYVALPALVLQKIPLLQFSWNLLIPALVPWLLLLCVAALVLLLGRLRHWHRDVVVALLIVLPLGNTSFLGFPMIEAFFGEAWLPYAMIYDQVGSFIALATWSTILAALYGVNSAGVNTAGASAPTSPDQTQHQAAPASAQNNISPTAMLKRILTFPPFLALCFGLVLKNWPYPPLLQALIDNLAQTLVPLIMFAVGFQLRFSFQGERWSPLLSGLGIKLLLMPALTLGGCLLLGLGGKAVEVSVFEAAMPPMITAGAVAMMAGLAPRLVAALVGFGLLLSFLTLPLWYWLLQQLLNAS